jgi:N-acetylmuramoyl-L-alanine amidase
VFSSNQLLLWMGEQPHVPDARPPAPPSGTVPPKRRGVGVRGLGLAGLFLLSTIALSTYNAPQLEKTTASAGGRFTFLTATQRKGHPLSGIAIDRSLFVKGACMAFPPTSGNRHKTVFLDAGHGGVDPGGLGETELGQTIDGSNENLPIELDTMALLRADGYRVVVSRTRNSVVARPGPGDVSGGVFTAQGEFDDVAARAVCANLAKANILIGISMNVGGVPAISGCTTSADFVRPFKVANLRLANLMQNDVVDKLNEEDWAVPNNGVQSDEMPGGPVPLSAAAATYDHFLLLGPAMAGYFSTPSEMPGALIEPLFITDPYEGSIAASPVGQQVIARGLAQAVNQYFRTPTPTPTPTTVLAAAEGP